MSILEPVDRFLVPPDVIDHTIDVLQEIGADGYEAFVLWGGRLDDGGRTCTFASVYCPHQRASASREGLLVVVDGDALFRANRAFYERGEILAAQVHSHPTDAYHSETDDEFPLMTLIGGLSIVVPDFAAGGRAQLDQWAWYRLVDQGRWQTIESVGLVSFVS